jgi:hypothetical protein
MIAAQENYQESNGEEFSKRPRTKNKDGVPFDGAEAFEAGFSAADCPYSSEVDDGDEGDEYDNFIAWNEDWDAAADLKQEAEDEEKSGSVVKEEYRARYKEMGHPTTCGDDLAVILDNLCKGKTATDLQRFEDICEANGVALGKYNRTSNGWQGRLRMTGRNMLARKVWLNNGLLIMPPNFDGAEPSYQMSSEWMATRKFAKGE